jgi:hypothetical protein
MKRIFILTIALCLFSQAQAQRYLPGQKGLQFTAGTINGFNINPKSSDFAFHAGAAFSTYTKNSNRLVFGAEYLERNYPYKELSLPQSQLTAEAGYYLKFFKACRNTMFFSLGTSVLAGYETINWDKKLLFDGATINNKDSFLYGGALTLETEIFLSDWLVLLVNVRERLSGGSSVGLLNTQIGVGFKFILN